MRQSIREHLDRKEAEKEMENNMPEAQTQDPELKALLQLLLEDKGREVQERQEKQKKEADERLQAIQAQIDGAREQNERNKLRRELCDGMGGPPHQTLNPANMNKRSAWRAQVNSDGTFSPVCCKCQLVMPKIRATDEQKREGVNLNGYVELSVRALEGWHASSYPEGCDFEMCHVCHPKKYPNKDCKNEHCHFCRPVKQLEAVAV